MAAESSEDVAAVERVLCADRGLNPQWLGSLLGLPVRVAVSDSSIWLRYELRNEQLRALEATLPGCRYRLLEHDWLVREGCSVAQASLPALVWRPLADLLTLVFPVPALGGSLQTAERPKLELVAGGVERPAEAGLFAIRGLAQWAETAPAVRLARLTYCISSDELLVLGTPLPPIAGQYLCKFERIVIPAGMTWTPSLDAQSVAERFGLADDEYLLWTETENWSIVPDQVLSPLTRGSLRAAINSPAASLDNGR